MAEQTKKERMGEKRRRKEIKGSTTSQNCSFNHQSNLYLLVSHTLLHIHRSLMNRLVTALKTSSVQAARSYAEFCEGTEPSEVIEIDARK